MFFINITEMNSKKKEREVKATKSLQHNQPKKIKRHFLTLRLHGKLNDANRVDLGGGSALGTVPMICIRPSRTAQ
jgi:hypothetical protein